MTDHPVIGEPTASGSADARLAEGRIALSHLAPARPPGEPVARVSALNVANAITVARLLLVPVFALALLHDQGGGHVWRFWAFAAFAVASLTDRLDGEVARRRGLVTDFGKVADPIADKALTGTALVVLSVRGDMPWWFTVPILFRELGVTVLRFWVIKYGVIAASRGGKAKTLLQTVAIAMYVLPFTGAWGTVRWWLMLAALAVTVVTGFDYVARAVRIRHEAGRMARQGEDADLAEIVLGPREHPDQERAVQSTAAQKSAAQKSATRDGPPRVVQ